eukprot:5577359-Amphidinium_carterae.1
MKARSNGKTCWWTCISCGSRWERMDYSPAEPSPHEIMGVGRHSQLRFLDVPSSYAQWALREYEEVGSDMHPQLQRFCQWQ